MTPDELAEGIREMLLQLENQYHQARSEAAVMRTVLGDAVILLSAIKSALQCDEGWTSTLQSEWDKTMPSVLLMAVDGFPAKGAR